MSPRWAWASASEGRSMVGHEEWDSGQDGLQSRLGLVHGRPVQSASPVPSSIAAIIRHNAAEPSRDPPVRPDWLWLPRAARKIMCQPLIISQVAPIARRLPICRKCPDAASFCAASPNAPSRKSTASIPSAAGMPSPDQRGFVRDRRATAVPEISLSRSKRPLPHGRGQFGSRQGCLAARRIAGIQRHRAGA